ncbi:MAG: hypothetical protein ACFFG0_34650, partial [Candidatus Thorarchaeota archaeon]
MKINKKIVILFCTTLVALSIFPSNALCQTTIEDSTVPVEEGETYKYICTYCDLNYSLTLGVGSYQNLTVDNIYQGTYMTIPNALIIDVTLGSWNKPEDLHDNVIIPSMIVYNSTLRYIYYDCFLFMVPTPINFTMVCESIESEWGGTCNFTGNQIIYKEFLDETTVYTISSLNLIVSLRATSTKFSSCEAKIMPLEELTIIPLPLLSLPAV